MPAPAAGRPRCSPRSSAIRPPSRRARRSAATGSRRIRRQTPPGAGPACSPRMRICCRKSSPGWRQQGQLRSRTALRRCPGATTAREVFFEAAIDWKLVMMPQTVPNRPMKGPAEPTVASTRSRRSRRSTSRAMVTSMTFSMRICRPAKERDLALEAAFPLPHGRHEQGRHRVGRLGGQRAIELLQRLTRPESLLESVHGTLGAGEQHELVDRDGPDPDRADQQPDHHEFDDPVRLPEQREKREVGGRERRNDRCEVGRVHDGSFRRVLCCPTGSVRAGPRTDAGQKRQAVAKALPHRPVISRYSSDPPPAGPQIGAKLDQTRARDPASSSA